MYEQVILNKDTKTVDSGSFFFSTNGAVTIGYLYAKKENFFSPFPHNI